MTKRLRTASKFQIVHICGPIVPQWKTFLLKSLLLDSEVITWGQARCEPRPSKPLAWVHYNPFLSNLLI